MQIKHGDVLVSTGLCWIWIAVEWLPNNQIKIFGNNELAFA